AGARVKLAGHEPQYTDGQRRMSEVLEEGLLRDPFSPPAPEELFEEAGGRGRAVQEVWEALLDNGTALRIAEGIFFHRGAVERIIERVRAHLARQKTMTASQFRDLIGSSRK